MLLNALPTALYMHHGEETRVAANMLVGLWSHKLATRAQGGQYDAHQIAAGVHNCQLRGSPGLHLGSGGGGAGGTAVVHRHRFRSCCPAT